MQSEEVTYIYNNIAVKILEEPTSYAPAHLVPKFAIQCGHVGFYMSLDDFCDLKELLDAIFEEETLDES